MSLGRVIRGSFWLYISSITSNFFGYIYWLLASKFVPPSIIGDASALIGIVSLITSLFSLGIHLGASRLFGRLLGQHDTRLQLSSSFSSSFAVNLLLYASAAILVLVLGPILGLAQLELIYIAILIILGAFPPVTTALYNASLRTSIIALSSILSATSRLILGLALLYLGTGFAGVMFAFIIAAVAQDLVLIVALRGIVYFARPSLPFAIESIRQGIPSYIPSLVATAGTWLGVLGIYTLSGSTEAGTYYIAFSISAIVYHIPTSLLGLMFPVLSGMKDGRKRAASRSIRLTSAIVAPIAAVLIAYPWVPLSMLGPSYIASSLAFQILMVGCFAASITSGFNSLVYAYGKYRYVTLLGLATNIPRVALYGFLVTLWGDSGASVSYISGFLVALFAVYFMSRRIGYSVGWRASLVFAGIPTLLSLIMIFTALHWVIGTLIILVASLFAYARLGLITRADLAEISSAFLSRKQLDQVYPYVKYILDILYGK